MGMRKATALLNTQAVRLLRLEKRLNAGPASCAELRAMLQISRASLKRDLILLREELGAPMWFDYECGGYRFFRPWCGVMAQLVEQAKGALVADFFSAPSAAPDKAAPTADAVGGEVANAAPRQLERA